MPKHHAVKMYGDVGVTPHIQVFLTLALGGINTQRHASGALTPGNETWVSTEFKAAGSLMKSSPGSEGENFLSLQQTKSRSSNQ
jgi:hypothetical protein